MTQYVGRVSFKHFKDLEDLETEMASLALAFCVETGVDAPCFVFEVGDCGEPHAHFYFESLKSDATLRRSLQKHFKLPPKVCLLKAKCIHICIAFISFIPFMSLFAVVLLEAR